MAILLQDTSRKVFGDMAVGLFFMVLIIVINFMAL